MGVGLGRIPKFIAQLVSKSSVLEEEKELIKTPVLHPLLCHFEKILKALEGKGFISLIFLLI